MADSQGLSPGDTGYDPYSDPDNALYGQVNPSAAPPPTPAATHGPNGETTWTTPDGVTHYTPGTHFVPAPPAGAAGPTGGIGGQPNVIDTTQTGGSSELAWLSAYLMQHPTDPGGAVNLFNQYFPNSTLRPQYYPDKQVIGVAGQRLPYLTAPGTTSGQTTWDFGGVPGGDGGGGKTGDGAPPPTLSGGGMLDIWPGYQQPTGAPQPWQAPTPYGEFKPPTPGDVRAQDPSYDFDLSEGIGALTNSAAAKGVVRGGGTLQGIESLGTNFADQQFGNIYNRDLGTYVANKNTYDMNTANSRQSYLDARQSYLDAYGIFKDNRDESLHQLDTLYGAGANAAGNA